MRSDSFLIERLKLKRFRVRKMHINQLAFSKKKKKIGNKNAVKTEFEWKPRIGGLDVPSFWYLLSA